MSFNSIKGTSSDSLSWSVLMSHCFLPILPPFGEMQVVNAFSIHRLLAISLVVSVKFHEDQIYSALAFVSSMSCDLAKIPWNHGAALWSKHPVNTRSSKIQVRIRGFQFLCACFLMFEQLLCHTTETLSRQYVLCKSQWLAARRA